MSVTSKTGLLPTSKKKNVESEVQETVTLAMPTLVVPAPFTLKPFAGIYNPFPYGCSVLCNHPADFESKSIVKKAKDAWVGNSVFGDTTEGKSLIDLDEFPILRRQEKMNQQPQQLISKKDKNENVPEELFRKYTNTDSRPITPTPTLTSIITKEFNKNLRTRRCMTPDPTSFTTAKEKTLLVLDLRRSHSHETVCWQGGYFDDPNFNSNVTQEANLRTDSPSLSHTQQKKKKIQRKKTSSPSATDSSLKMQASKDSDLKGQTQRSSVTQSPIKTPATLKQENSSQNLNGSPKSSAGDMSVVKRRGKKTKKAKKSGKGEKEFQGIQEPGETQVSALENDFKGSSRQSLTEEEKFTENPTERNSAYLEPKPLPEEITESFLNRETLKKLQRQLDQETVDSEFNAKRKIALEEALKHKKNPKQSQQGEEMKNLKKEFQVVIKDSEKWLSIPRVFTRRSVRFELPMDSRELINMTPMQYVQNYVFASPERLVLYNHLFNLYKEDPEDDEERTRIMLGKNVTKALGKIMGRSLTTNEANEFQKLLNWQDEASLDFRTFTGISATCERLMSPKFCSKMLSQNEDPRHEIEKADFETLDEKLLRLNPDRNLVKILKSIRDV